MPTGEEIETNGLNVDDVMKGIQQNSEENTLDIIDLFNLVKQQKIEIEILKQIIEDMKKR